jgi:hypothetical protein
LKDAEANDAAISATTTETDTVIIRNIKRVRGTSPLLEVLRRPNCVRTVATLIPILRNFVTVVC